MPATRKRGGGGGVSKLHDSAKNETLGFRRLWTRVRPRPSPSPPGMRSHCDRGRHPRHARSARRVPGITPAAAPSAAAAPAGPSVAAADNHQTPTPSPSWSLPPRPPSLISPKPNVTRSRRGRRGRPTRPASPLCVRCGTPGQETSPLAPQTEGMCLPAD